jgi:hypothetical protein
MNDLEKLMTPTQGASRCPFYGQCALPVLQTTHPTGGNQCALVIEALSPCVMEVYRNQPPDWAKCERNAESGMRARAEKILEWSRNDEGRKMLFQFDYPD